MSRRIVEIESLADDPCLRVYGSLTDTQLRSRIDPSAATIIVESPKVIATALQAGLQPLSLLTERRHITGDATPIIEMLPDEVPVFTGSREVLASLTGYTLTRGVLCAMRRPQPLAPEQAVAGARRVVVIDAVSDTTNIGSIFRSAAALGIDAVLLTPTACDPLNRRSIRVSMGSVFLVPWARVDNAVDAVKQLGFKTVAMALRHDSVEIDSPVLRAERRLAIVMGTEGEGLDLPVILASDYVAKIPMAHGVDSLNVGAAAAVAFWALRR